MLTHSGVPVIARWGITRRKSPASTFRPAFLANRPASYVQGQRGNLQSHPYSQGITPRVELNRDLAGTLVISTSLGVNDPNPHST
jgi:hypothetical protein